MTLCVCVCVCVCACVCVCVRVCVCDILSVCDVCFVGFDIIRCHANIKYEIYKLGISLDVFYICVCEREREGD